MQEMQKIKHARRMVQQPYAIWTYTERMTLLKTRIKYDDMFTSQNANISAGWRKVVADCSSKLASDKTYLNCIQQWNALMKKYKSLFKLNIGKGASHEAPEDQQNNEEWPYFNVIHQYAGEKENFHPTYLIDISNGVILNNNLKRDYRLLSATIKLSPRQSPTPTVSYVPKPAPSMSSSHGQTPSTSQSNDKSMSYDQYMAKREKRDCKIEKKINGLLGVFGHMIRKDYPDINVDALLTSSESDDSE